VLAGEDLERLVNALRVRTFPAQPPAELGIAQTGWADLLPNRGRQLVAEEWKVLPFDTSYFVSPELTDIARH
jgi:hypothetical protein